VYRNAMMPSINEPLSQSSQEFAKIPSDLSRPVSVTSLVQVSKGANSFKAIFRLILMLPVC
jgi:hypothetical protein